MKTDKSTIAAAAVEFIGQLYGIKHDVKGMAPTSESTTRLTGTNIFISCATNYKTKS